MYSMMSEASSMSMSVSLTFTRVDVCADSHCVIDDVRCFRKLKLDDGRNHLDGEHVLIGERLCTSDFASTDIRGRTR